MARLPRTLARLVALPLLLSPKEFRQRFGPEVQDAMERGLQEADQRGGASAMFGFWGRGMGDALKTAAHERRMASGGWFGDGNPWSDLGGDVKYALRGWRRSPGFSLTVVTTLGLGLGLASAIFAFADGYLFRPLPFPGGDRTYYVRDPHAQIALKASDTVALRASAVAGFGFVEWSPASLGGELVVGDRRVSPLVYEVSEGFRNTLKLPLLAGRDFAPEDHLAGAPRVAWLSHRFWRREFGGDIGALGRPLRIERVQAAEELRIVGILGPEVASFDLNNSPPDLIAPHRGPPQVGPNRLSFPLVLVPIGVSVDQAAQQISAALQAVAPAADGRPREVRLRALSAAQTAGGRPTAKVLLTGALLVLLLASMNLIHLLLSRSMARALEVATRASLGASRWRVIRVFVVESLLLGAAGITLGLAVGKALSVLISANVPQWPTAGRNLALVPMLFDFRVMAFAVVLGLAVSVAGGLWPAWLALRRPMTIHQRTAGGVNPVISGRLSRVILGSELTVATMVIVGAVFVGLGIYRYLNQPLGYEYKDRLRVFVSSDGGGPVAGQEAGAAVRAVRGVTGVREAGFERSVSRTRDVEVVDRAVDTKEISALGVTAGYFEAWGMHLQQGRWFDAGEFLDPADIVVVDDRFARVAWPDADPIGATVRAAGRLRKVVGVVQSRRELLDRELPPVLYVPASDSAGRDAVVAWAPDSDLVDMNTRMTAAVQAAVPGAVVTVTKVTFEGLFLRGIGEAQFQAPIVTTFGVLAVILAGIGIFGLVSYLVEQRTREFGIRMALGAKLQDIRRTVMRESIQPTLIGLLLGSAGALALESVVQSSVFGWKSSGVTAVAIVAIGLLLVAIIAALIPAGRAARVDPATTLRSE